MEKTKDLEEVIRYFINLPRKKTKLLKERIVWNKICSSLDVIGDTNLAIDSYLDNLNIISSDGEIYIFLYGIFQVLFVQQDAVKHLCEALVIEYIDTEKLKQIREIRNDTIGHPTKRGNNKSFSFIVRFNMSKSNFTYNKYIRDTKDVFQDVDVVNLINNQKDEIIKKLQKIIIELKKEEKEYRKKYMEKKLIKLIPDTLDYYFEKAYKLANPLSYRNYNLIGLKSIKNVLDTIKNELIKREIYDSYESVKEVIEILDYAISKIQNNFSESNSFHLTNNDVYIYVDFIKNQMNELKDMLKELDDDYSKFDDLKI